MVILQQRPEASLEPRQHLASARKYKEGPILEPRRGICPGAKRQNRVQGDGNNCNSSFYFSFCLPIFSSHLGSILFLYFVFSLSCQIWWVRGREEERIEADSSKSPSNALGKFGDENNSLFKLFWLNDRFPRVTNISGTALFFSLNTSSTVALDTAVEMPKAWLERPALCLD